MKLLKWRLFYSLAKGRVSKRKMLALIKTLSGIATASLVPWLATKGLDVSESTTNDTISSLLHWVFIIVGSKMGIDGARDWDSRDSEG